MNEQEYAERLPEFLSKKKEIYETILNDGYMQQEYDTFCKEKLHHYERLDRTYDIENDNEEMYQMMLERQKTYDIYDTYNQEKNILETSILRSVEMYILITLQTMGYEQRKIAYILKQFQEKYTKSGINSLYKFYFSMISKQLTVNLYIDGDIVVIKSKYEHDTLQQKYPTLIGRTYTQISMNEMITNQFGKNFMDTRDKSYYLLQGEREVIEQIRQKDFVRDFVNVEVKKGKVDVIKTIGKQENLSLFKELLDRYPHSKIAIQQYKGIKQHITIESRKKPSNSGLE